MGALYGKKELLEELNPFLVGGETVKDTTYTSREWENLPERFEAGLQNYAGIMGFAEATRYLEKIGLKNIEKHEEKLNSQLTDGLNKYGDVKIIGPSPDKRGGITSFTIGKSDPHQIAMLLDHSANIMIRSGAHCVHSWFNKHKISGTARASLYLYNTPQEVDYFLENIKKIRKLL